VAVRDPERRTAALDDLIARAEVLLADQLGGRTVERAAPGVRLLCDPDQATQILANLLSNGLDAAGPAGRVGVDWRPDGAGGGALGVWDSGPGPALEPAQLFAPWVSTKPGGTGLGLAITNRLVRAHGWSIDVARPEGLTRFEVTIPASDVVAER
jgi:signal transduction histidine kinase